MNRADAYLAYLEAAANPSTNPDHYKDYIWGAAGYDADGRDGDPEWDCSGLFYAALHRGAGMEIERLTANDYKNMGHPIDGPSKVGDFRLHVNGSGHATHIMEYAPRADDKTHTIEAKGSAYGVLRLKIADGHGPWYRIDAVAKYLGEPSWSKPPVKYRVGLIDANELAHRRTVYAETLGLAPGIDIFSKPFTHDGKKMVAWSGIFPNYAKARQFMDYLEREKVTPRYAKPIVNTDVGVSAYLGQLIANYK